MSDAREAARELAREHLEAGDPLGWFEHLYARAEGDTAAIPWADLAPNPLLVEWLDRETVTARNALMVGCGLGDDAEELARRGFETTAFDIAESAIAWCRERHPRSPVSFVVADLLSAPPAWRGGFDLVLESYTLQALSPELRADAIRSVASLVAPGGTLLVIARGREPTGPSEGPPWPLTRDELSLFEPQGLAEVSFEDTMDGEDPPVRRFRVTYRREA